MIPFHRYLRGALACALVWLAIAPAHAQHVIRKPDMTFDAAESTNGWTSGNTLSRDTQIKVHHTSSLKSTGGSAVRFRKLFANSVNVTSFRYLTFWYYIDRPDLLATTGDTGQIEISSSNTDDQQEWFWQVSSLNLQRGWNFIRLDLPGSVRRGPVDATNIRRIRIYHASSASITTRIDHITFSSHEPSSFAFAEFLKQKRMAVSTAAVEQEDEMFALIQSAAPGSPERNRVCRYLRVHLLHRQISSYSLEKMGVSRATLDASLGQYIFLKEVMCDERSTAPGELQVALQLLAAADVAVVGAVTTLFGTTAEASAETVASLLDMDLNRILSGCGGSITQVDAYIATGRLPSGSFPGPSILVPQCTGTPSQISVAIGRLFEPSVSDRRANYQQCMSAFENFGTQCDNPYANPDDDFEERIKTIPNMSESSKDAARGQMIQMLEKIESITTFDARRDFGIESHADPNHPDFQHLEGLHEQLDRNNAQFQYTEQLLDHTQKHTKAPEDLTFPEQDAYISRQRAIGQRLKDEMKQLEAEHDDLVRHICSIGGVEDESCPSYMANEPPPPDQPPPTPSTERCASMTAGDGQNYWFNRPATPADPSGANPFAPRAPQVNEADRIDHCLCQLFDRAYNLKLPGDLVQLPSNCPTPEERIAQKCLEDPREGVNGLRLECAHLMQPIAIDRDAQAAKWCKLIRPNCDGYLESDSDCGCGTINPNGLMTIPGCRGGVPNCPNGIRVQDPFGTCGCAPFDSGINQCTPGGKDFYLTLDPVNDLKVRVFPDKAGFANKALLVTKPGPVRFVTPGVKRSQLAGNGSVLTVNAGLVGNTADKTGNIKVYCTNSTATTANRNRLIETIPLSNLNSTGPTAVTINLDSNDRNVCYGSNADSNVYFEFFVESAPQQQVAFNDILGDLGNIKPPCVDFPPRPTPGQRPLSNWPALWTLSNGTRVAPRFNGLGTIPPVESPPIGGVCIKDGIPVPCN
jgi:hypothetical protein